jgi:hypothetical protein
MMEQWNNGKLKLENHSYLVKLLQTHYSTIPVFQYSKCERSELDFDERLPLHVGRNLNSE